MEAQQTKILMTGIKRMVAKIREGELTSTDSIHFTIRSIQQMLEENNDLSWKDFDTSLEELQGFVKTD